jgi:hypothetical protein
MGRTTRAVGRRDKNGTDGAVEYAAAVALGAADDSAAAKKEQARQMSSMEHMRWPGVRAAAALGAAQQRIRQRRQKKKKPWSRRAGRACGEGVIEENTRGHTGPFDLDPTVKKMRAD